MQALVGVHTDFELDAVTDWQPMEIMHSEGVGCHVYWQNR